MSAVSNPKNRNQMIHTSRSVRGIGAGIALLGIATLSACGSGTSSSATSPTVPVSTVVGTATGTDAATSAPGTTSGVSTGSAATHTATSAHTVTATHTATATTTATTTRTTPGTQAGASSSRSTGSDTITARPCNDALRMQASQIGTQGGRMQTMIFFTNESGTRCQMKGFPGVDLKLTNGHVVHARRAQGEPMGDPILLPGQRANALLETRDDGTTISSAVVTPPNWRENLEIHVETLKADGSVPGGDPVIHSVEQLLGE